MKIKKLMALNALTVALVACGGGGDINLNPSNTVTDSNNVINEGGGNTETNPCAHYSSGGQSFRGTYADGDCTYGVNFVSDTRPLTDDLFIPELADDGLHIFEDSLFVGEDVSANSANAGVRVPQDGEGAVLTIAAGAKIAFSGSNDYVRIARGSRIIAEGTAEKPIIFSAVQDLRDGSATESDRGLWGGIQINGNGLTNKCTDAQRQTAGNNPHSCHITAEGRPATYGGANNAENSGVLRYVVVKHAGYEVVDGSELNGITFNAVGSGTTVEYVQTYTTQDDGFEMFGGGVNLKYVVAVNVGDDSYDYSEGWVGNIQFALAVHTSGANYCVEADNTGSDRDDDIQPLTKGRISNMTCVLSNVASGQGDSPSSKGNSRGAIYREGAFFEMYNSIITANTTGMEQEQCLVLTDSEGPQTIDAAEAGWSVAHSNLIACTSPLHVGRADVGNEAFILEDWLNDDAINSNNVVFSSDETGALPITVLEGLDSNPRAYLTLAEMADGNTNPITIPVYDVTQLEDEFEAGAVPALGGSGSSSFFEEVDFIGAVKVGDDWTAGWTVGLTD
jgi:hypothetical protein